MNRRDFAHCHSKKTIIAVIVIVFTLTGLFSQTVKDSLYNAIDEYHGLPSIEARLELAYSMRKSDFDESYFQAKRAFSEAKIVDDLGLQARALYFLGLTHYHNDKADTALKYFSQSVELYRSDRNNEQLSKVLCMMGTTYLNVTGNQHKAITHYNEALIYARKLDDHKTMGMIYSQLSNVFRMNGAYRQAIEFIYKSKEHYEKIGFNEGVAWISYSIGRIYTTMSLYDEAQKEFEEGLNEYRMLSETVSSMTGVAICLDELGLVSLEQGNVESARQYNLEAQTIYKKINSKFGMSNALKYLARIEYKAGNSKEALYHLGKSRRIKKDINDMLGFPGVYNLYGKILLDQKRYQEAIDSLNVGLEYATRNSQNNRIMRINEQLAEIYAELNDYDMAYYYRTTQVAINDSIYQSKATRSMTQLESVYDLEIRETKIRELEQENLIKEINLEREITVRNLLLIILTMTIVFTFFLLKLFTSNRNVNIILKRNQKKLQELNATKDKFTSIIAHDLKSPFNTILGFSSLMERYWEQKDYAKIKEFSGYIHDVSLQTYKLLENLLEWSRSQTGKIAFNPKALDIHIPIKNAVDLLEPAANRKQVTISMKAPSMAVMVDEKMLHTILQNLISNAIKYSHHGGNITIVAKEKGKQLEISIRDQGVGMDENTLNNLFHIDQTVIELGTDGEKGTGLGLILSKEFVERHRGKIFAESEKGKGSIFTISIPL
ncbi:MAG: tetratricopeptide repeat protein [Candidatus Marinimicrobia bacterium]|nr:tetratricopeptide repeat protein [Candidatus Neomarinimicrobiota bacterium]